MRSCAQRLNGCTTEPPVLRRLQSVGAAEARRVSDFTYVATWDGFVFVAFVIDVFARRIGDWRVPPRRERPSCWMRSSRRPTRGATPPSQASCITAAMVSTSRCATPITSPTPASCPRSGARCAGLGQLRLHVLLVQRLDRADLRRGRAPWAADTSRGRHMHPTAAARASLRSPCTHAGSFHRP